MNQLANLLKVERIGRPRIQGPDINSDFEEAEEEEAENFREELEALLRSFEDDEIKPEEQSTEVSLNEPVLLLLAQNRSFRICRREVQVPFISGQIRFCLTVQAHRSLSSLTEDGPCRSSQPVFP
jgi:hypothetical protein